MKITLTLSFSDKPTQPGPLTATFDAPDDISASVLQTDLNIEVQKEILWGEFRAGKN